MKKLLLAPLLLSLWGCVKPVYVRKNVTNVYDVQIPQEVTDIQIWVEGEWWTVERFVRPIK